MDKRTIAVTALTIGIIICVCGSIFVLAETLWSKEFTWTTPPTESFQVYTDDTLTTLWQQGSEALGEQQIGAVITKTFYILNDGDAVIEVEVADTPPVGTSTVSWGGKTKTNVLSKNGIDTLTLTITVAEAGSYNFDFRVV